SDTVTLTAGTTPDGVKSVFVAIPKSIVADNIATSTLLFTAKDAFGNNIRNLAASLSIEVKDSLNATPAAGKVAVSTVSETSTAGVYTATLKGT
ncbi:hypothetical protein GV764_13515, partial [Atlantibacter hermannii]